MTETSAPTPGPWVSEDGINTGRRVVAPSAPKTRRTVAACGGPNRRGNANLIAAAPDLWDVLMDANQSDSLNDDVRAAWWERRDAALAKATPTP